MSLISRIFDLMMAVKNRVPALVDAFAHRQVIDRHALDALIGQANALTSEQDPTSQAVIDEVVFENIEEEPEMVFD